MKKIFVLISLILTLSLVGCGNTKYDLDQIKAEGVLRVAINAEFAPFEYRDNGEFVGFDIELIKAFGQYLRVEVKFTDMDFDAALLSVSLGKADVVISAVTANDSRRQSMSFSNGYFEASQVVIVKNDSAITGSDPESIIKSLEGKTIGVQRGTVGQYFVEGDQDWDYPGINNANCIAYDNGGLAIKALENGSIDAVIIDSAPAKAYVLATTGIKYLPVSLTEEEYAIATWLGNDSLVAELNTFLASYLYSDDYLKLINKYFS